MDRREYGARVGPPERDRIPVRQPESFGLAPGLSIPRPNPDPDHTVWHRGTCPIDGCMPVFHSSGKDPHPRASNPSLRPPCSSWRAGGGRMEAGLPRPSRFPSPPATSRSSTSRTLVDGSTILLPSTRPVKRHVWRASIAWTWVPFVLLRHRFPSDLFVGFDHLVFDAMVGVPSLSGTRGGETRPEGPCRRTDRPPFLWKRDRPIPPMGMDGSIDPGDHRGERKTEGIPTEPSNRSRGGPTCGAQTLHRSLH
eukprot:scaffold653_cov345-Pavlova_lutheri.AAC.8